MKRGSNLHARSRQEAEQAAGSKAGVTAKDLQGALTAFNMKPKAGMAQLTKLGVLDGTSVTAVRVAGQRWHSAAPAARCPYSEGTATV